MADEPKHYKISLGKKTDKAPEPFDASDLTWDDATFNVQGVYVNGELVSGEPMPPFPWRGPTRN